MPRQERIKTKHPGVYFIMADGARGKEKIYYILYRRDGKQIEEKAGCQFADDMTEAKAAGVRADRMRGKELPNTEKRKAAKAAKLAHEEKWTLSRLWNEYKAQKPDSNSIKYDGYRFKKFLEPKHGKKEPSELHQLDVDRLRINIMKVRSPQTAKHVLELLRRLCNFGVKKQLCQGIKFKIELPRVDNQRTEDLNSDQIKNLLGAMEKSPDKEAADFMKMALFTGMRRGELMKLTWNDVDFDRGFIHITHDPKGGKSQKIPLNEQARVILENHPRLADHVFIRKNGKPLNDVINVRVRLIRDAAGLSSDFRPLHGLRHAYASMLASSGQVDLYTLQKLLTHKSPLMTQRYAHLRDETMRKASTLAGNIIEQAAKADDQEGKEAVGA
ncbi:MAG: site-specific integrase [Deltaproteobacteria bacterium]|nr:site-specific integrase [Deltaproteobacteria bacterium]